MVLNLCNCFSNIHFFLFNSFPSRYWRASNTTKEFVNCASAFQTGDVETLSKFYCIGTNGNASFFVPHTTKNITSIDHWNANDQCVQGSAGPLCAVCAKEYVKVGENCAPCPGGANYLAPAMTLLGECFVLFLISFILIYRTKGHEEAKELTATRVELKILISWLQILSVVAQTFDSVAWPGGFTSASQSTSVVNLDITSYVSGIGAACSLAIPFMSKFAVSASAPIGLTLAIKFGERVAIMLTGDSKITTVTTTVDKSGKKRTESTVTVVTAAEKLQPQRSKANKTILMILMLLYPSIANQAFLMFRCRSVDGLLDEKGDFILILDNDYSIECYVGDHAQYVWVAYAAIVLYAIGVPLVLFYMLWSSRMHLHEKNVKPENHHHHLEVKSRLGQFFMQCKLGWRLL